MGGFVRILLIIFLCSQMVYALDNESNMSNVSSVPWENISRVLTNVSTVYREASSVNGTKVFIIKPIGNQTQMQHAPQKVSGFPQFLWSMGNESKTLLISVTILSFISLISMGLLLFYYIKGMEG
jgi:hypothetical protein